MKMQLAVVFVAFILSLLSFGRQIYDSDISCLDTDEICVDKGHTFKDTDLDDEEEVREPLYPGYYDPHIEIDYDYS